MRITFTGTCSGTEPMAGRHHCSFVIEHNLGVYWFDAGECCSHTGYLAREDVCVYLRDSMMGFGQLGFIHHGRAILRNAEVELRKAREILGDKVSIANDGMVKEL